MFLLICAFFSLMYLLLVDAVHEPRTLHLMDDSASSSASSKAAEDRRANDGENVERGSLDVQSIMDMTRRFPIHFGNAKMTLGGKHDLTPKDLIPR